VFHWLADLSEKEREEEFKFVRENIKTIFLQEIKAKDPMKSFNDIWQKYESDHSIAKFLVLP